jgi:hypothetical protein
VLSGIDFGLPDQVGREAECDIPIRHAIERNTYLCGLRRMGLRQARDLRGVLTGHHNLGRDRFNGNRWALP